MGLPTATGILRSLSFSENACMKSKHGFPIFFPSKNLRISICVCVCVCVHERRRERVKLLHNETMQRKVKDYCSKYTIAWIGCTAGGERTRLRALLQTNTQEWFIISRRFGNGSFSGAAIK